MSDERNLDFPSRKFSQEVYVICIFLNPKQKYCISRALFILSYIAFTIFFYFEMLLLETCFLIDKYVFVILFV